MSELNRDQDKSLERAAPALRPSGAVPSPPPPVAKIVGLSMVRLSLALGVAAIADTIGIPFGEIGVVVFDVCVGLVLFAILGFRVELLFATVLEAIPMVGMFPSWVLAVAAIWARRPKA